jgi:2,4-diaminopentanoate dehydrogenase
MLNIVLWTIGVVGKSAAPAIHHHPAMRLVGCYTMSAEKDGVDVGTLAGVEQFGLSATRDIDALLALKPDCILYAPQFPDVDHMVRILESGCNIVSTAYFMNGRAFGDESYSRIRQAALKGGSSIYGTGINPGFANVLGLLATSACARVDRISVLESVDCTNYASRGTWEAMGIDRPLNDPDVPAFIKKGTPSFREAVDVMADALNVPLDDVRFDVEFGAATEHVDLGYMTIRKGHIAAIRGTWSGWVGERPFIALKIAWKLGYKLEPDWPMVHGYHVEIEGNPNVRCHFEPVGATMFDPGLVTAMPSVHAIPAVCAAAPGIVTAADLPLIVARDCGPKTRLST